MNKIYKFSAWWMACLVLLSSLTFTACDTNDVDTNQYKGGISLNVFGPSPCYVGVSCDSLVAEWIRLHQY